MQKSSFNPSVVCGTSKQHRPGDFVLVDEKRITCFWSFCQFNCHIINIENWVYFFVFSSKNLPISFLALKFFFTLGAIICEAV